MILVSVGFQKRKQGLFEYQLKKWPYKCWKCANEPQSYLKILFSWNNPYLECFYLGIQVGSANMDEVFGLPPTFVTWDSKVTSTQIPFREHQSSENFKLWHWFKISPTLADLCPMPLLQMCLFCCISKRVYFPESVHLYWILFCFPYLGRNWICFPSNFKE